MTTCKTGKIIVNYYIVMDVKEFEKKIKKEEFWDTVHYYKKWNGYYAFIVGIDGSKGDYGEDQVILVKDDIQRYATEDERCEILDTI